MTSSANAKAAEGAADRVERRLTDAAWVAALLLFAPLLVPLFSGRIFALDDLGALHAPLRHVYQSALSAGHSLLWTSQLYGGFYIHAEGEVGAFHPLHLLLYATLPLTIAFNLEVVLSYVFAFAGMWHFLKHRGFSAASRTVGAIAFAFSGYVLLHFPHMHAIAVTAHVPWLLLAIDGSVSESATTRRKGLIAIALLAGSQGLLGHPQSLWMSGLICLAYAVICHREAARRLLLAGAAMAAGLMLAGIQLVPSMDLLGSSARGSMEAEFALSYSLHPLNILQLVSPYMLADRVYAAEKERYIHEFGIYSGSLSTIALAWALLRSRRVPFERLTLFALVLAAAGVLLALGRYGLVYEWLAAAPVISKFRAPARHILLVHFGLAILVAILIEDIRRLRMARSTERSRHRWLWVPMLISAGAAAIAWRYPRMWGTFPDQEWQAGGMLIGTGLLAFVTLLVTDAARGSRPALMLLPVVFALDLGIWGYSYIFAGPTRRIDELAARAAPPTVERGSTVHQTLRTNRLNALLLRDVRVLRPAVALPPVRTLTLSSASELRVSGAQWTANGTDWTRVDDPMPRVRVVPEWRVVANPAAIDGIDIRQTALLSEDPGARPGGDASATLAIDEPGRIVVDVSARGQALLVTTEAYDRGWRATGRSGAPLRTLPVYGDYLAVVAEPGDYRLLLAFEPASMRVGIYTSVTGSIVVLLIAALAGSTPFSRPSRRAAAEPLDRTTET